MRNHLTKLHRFILAWTYVLIFSSIASYITVSYSNTRLLQGISTRAFLLALPPLLAGALIFQLEQGSHSFHLATAESLAELTPPL